MIIKSIEKTFAILEYIASNGGMARLMDIAKAMNLSKTTAHNLLDTLKKLGYVDQIATSPRYFITDKFADLHAPICSTPEIRNLVQATIVDLAKELKVNTFMAMQSGVYFYYDITSTPEGKPVDTLESGKDQEMVHTAVGKVFIAFSPTLENALRKQHPGAITKSMTAELAQVRTNRYALDIETYVPNQNCIAFPLIYRHHVLAVLGCYGSSSRLDRNTLDRAILLFLKAISIIRAEMNRG